MWGLNMNLICLHEKEPLPTRRKGKRNQFSYIRGLHWGCCVSREAATDLPSSRRNQGPPWWSSSCNSELPLQGVQVRSLIGDLRSHMLHGRARKKERKKSTAKEAQEHSSLGYLDDCKIQIKQSRSSMRIDLCLTGLMSYRYQ